MSSKFHFTAAAIDKLKIPEAGVVAHWDTDRKRFGLRVSHTGSKTFVVTTRVFRIGRWHSARIFAVGRHPDMSLADTRERARDMLALAKARKDPSAIAAAELAADVTRTTQTIEAISKRFIEEFLERGAGRKRPARPATIEQYRWMLTGRT